MGGGVLRIEEKILINVEGEKGNYLAVAYVSEQHTVYVH